MQPQYNFIENQSMARQYLFEVISNDTTLLRDSLLNEFYADMQNQTEGQLEAVKEYLGNVGKMDDTFIPLLLLNDSLMHIYADYLEHFNEMSDSIKIAGQDPDSVKEQWVKQIDLLKQSADDIVLQHNAVRADALMEGELTNTAINGDEQNEINSVRLNEIAISLENNNYENIDEFYAGLLTIAQQCPYYGGEAVYRARAILELVNDSIIYDDDANCMLAGYYRKSGVIKITDKISGIIVKPNPANKAMIINVSCNTNQMFSYEIVNELAQTVLSGELLCNKDNFVTVSQLKQGVYTVKVKTSDTIKYFKTAIAR